MDLYLCYKIRMSGVYDIFDRHPSNNAAFAIFVFIRYSVTFLDVKSNVLVYVCVVEIYDYQNSFDYTVF